MRRVVFWNISKVNLVTLGKKNGRCHMTPAVLSFIIINM